MQEEKRKVTGVLGQGQHIPDNYEIGSEDGVQVMFYVLFYVSSLNLSSVSFGISHHLNLLLFNAFTATPFQPHRRITGLAYVVSSDENECVQYRIL